MNSWLKNLTGLFKITEEEEKDIPYPFIELGLHITAKTVQVGCTASAINYLIFRPIWYKVRGTVGGGRIGLGGLAFGLIAGPAMTYGRVNLAKEKITDEGLYDRCYRIRHNKGQLNVDRVTAVTGVLGLPAGLPGLVWGVAAGVVGYNAYAFLYPMLNPEAKKNEGNKNESTETEVKKVEAKLPSPPTQVTETVEKVKKMIPKRKDAVKKDSEPPVGTESLDNSLYSGQNGKVTPSLSLHTPSRP